MNKDKRKLLADMGYEDTIVFENPAYETAIIGISYDDRAIYDLDLMIDYLVENDGMTEEEALEFIDYNTVRACDYIEGAPIIITRLIND